MLYAKSIQNDNAETTEKIMPDKIIYYKLNYNILQYHGFNQMIY